MLKITESFHAPSSLVATSLVVYLLGGSSLQLILGPISDAIGRRPVLVLGGLLFFFFTLNLYYSSSMTYFLWGRFFQGTGLCFLIIGYAAIQEMFPELEAVRLIALLANAAIIAPLLGPLIGALFILHWDWRNLYAITAFLSLISSFGIWYFMPETIDIHDNKPHLLPRNSLIPLSIIKNYWALLTNLYFMMGVIGLGFLSIPCLAWIGLAPLILMQKAHLSLIGYALWQIPFFTTCILGNFFLRWLTHHYQIKTIIKIGTTIALTGLVLMGLIPYFFEQFNLAPLPGLLIYGFGLGTTAGPMTRFILFITPISKGTTNALINVTDLMIMGVGTEIANHIYSNQNNLYFGVYCAMIGIVCFLLILFTLRKNEKIIHEKAF